MSDAFFSHYGPVMRENGWTGVLPLVPGEKRPAFQKWETLNKRDATAEEVQKWASVFRYHGVGHASGRGAVCFDVDLLDAEAAAEAEEIVTQRCGTGLVRIGRWPKRVIVFACAGDTRTIKSKPGLEIYGGSNGSSGQVAMYGIHPTTGQEYTWRGDQGPSNVGLRDLPTVSADQVAVVLEDAAHLLPSNVGQGVQRAGHSHAGIANTGTVSALLALLKAAGLYNVSYTDLPGFVAQAVAATDAGGRHYAAVAGAVLLCRWGFDDGDIEAAITDGLSAATAGELARNAAAEARGAVQWARGRYPATMTEIAARLPFLADLKGAANA